MSVLIKGIELPERVQVLELHHDGKVFTRKGYLVGEAVALPDHHGRLVDADAFKADYGMKDDCADCEKEMRGKVRACEYDRIYSKMDFCGWLDDAPTIVEAEGENADHE